MQQQGQAQLKRSNTLDLTPSIPIDLCELTPTDDRQVVIQLSIQDTIFPPVVAKPLNEGVTLRSTDIAEFPSKLRKDLSLTEPVSKMLNALIYPKMSDGVTKVMLSNLSPKEVGIFQKIKGSAVLAAGTHRIGVPAGSNDITITVSGSTIELKDVINAQSFDLKKRSLVLVKAIPKKLEPSDEPFDFCEVKASTDTSRRHATIIWENSKVTLYDGMHYGPGKTQCSTHGVWINLPHDQPSEFNEEEVYAFTNFKAKLTIKNK